MAPPLIIISVSELSHSQGEIVLKIKILPFENGISLIELLSALDIIRHSQNLKLVGLISDSPQSYEFTQALFQAKYYFPDINSIIG